MHDAPLTVALFQHRSTQPTAIDVTLLSITHHIGGDGVLERGPSCLAGKMNTDIAESVFSVLHLTHLRHEVMVAVIRPTVVGMPTLKDRQRFIIGPDLRGRGNIILFKTRRALH